MRLDRAFLLCCAVASLALALPGAANAGLRPISGTLSAPGYTVIALAGGGEARWVVARRGPFLLRPVASRVTLHLKAPNGAYAGPVVVGRRGSRVILGVRAGARLGKVSVRRRGGYAKAVRRLSRRWRDARRWARAVKGVPIGAGNLGRVRSVAPRRAPPGDLDADGVANALDVDDDGDRVLDDVDRRRARAAQVAGEAPGPLGAFTTLWMLGSAIFAEQRTQPINVNALAGNDASVEAALIEEGTINLSAVAEGKDEYVAGELDCRGLTYCARGGTGRRLKSQFDPAPDPFPACCDADGDGLGSLTRGYGGVDGLGLALEPHATSDTFRTGDVLLARAECRATCGPSGSKERRLAGTLGSVFATTPALASYTDESGTIHELAYPIPAGTRLPVADGPDPGSDISATLTFWRPQRRALPEEVAAGSASWIDMGGLLHFAHTLGRDVTTFCPMHTYSGYENQPLIPTEQQLPSDIGLRPVPVFVDRDRDQPASRGHTFSYTLNLTQCFRERGQSFDPGGVGAMVFSAQLPRIPGVPINNAMSGYAFQAQ